MSKIAQETARLVEEMRKKERLKAPKTAKRYKGETMDDERDEPANEPPADEGDGLDALLEGGTNEEIDAGPRIDGESTLGEHAAAKSEGRANDMATKKRSHKKKASVWKDPSAPKAEKKAKKVKAAKPAKAKKASKPKAEKKPKAAKKVKADGEGRVLKTYRLVDGIPKDMKTGTAAYQILEAIKTLGNPTGAEIRAELPKSFSRPTLQFNLGKFQREKIVTTKAK